MSFFLSSLQQWRPSRPPLISRRKRMFGSCRSSTIRTCFLRCPASWSQKTCEGTKRTYKPYLQNLLFPPINPDTQPFILHCHRSTQLVCQSSQAAPPNAERGNLLMKMVWIVLLSDSVSMLIMTTHRDLDSFLLLFFSLFTTEGKPVLIALPSVELNQTEISFSSGPSEKQTAFWLFITLKYMRQSDLLNSDLWSSLFPCQHWHFLQPCVTWLQSLDLSVLNNMDPQPSNESRIQDQLQRTGCFHK